MREATINDILPDGWFELSDEKEFFKKTTNYGVLLFSLEIKRLDAIIRDLAAFSVLDLTDIPKTFDEVEALTGVEFDRDHDVIIDIDGNEDICNEIDILTRETERYVRANLPAMLDTAIWSFIEESLMAAVFKRLDKGFFNFGITELEAFRKVQNKRFDDLRERMNIRKSAGADLYWTDDRKLALLELYEKLQPLAKAAKQAYRKLRNFRNWGKLIATEYPDLPEEIIALLPRTKKDGEPGLLVLTYASSLFNQASISYMLKQIAEAREIRAARN